MVRKTSSFNDKISNHFEQYLAIYTFIIILFTIGVIFGAIVVNSLSLVQKEDLFFYLNDFFSQVNLSSVVENKQLLVQSYTHNSKFIVLIWCLGISIVGLPLTLILIFVKGIVMGFTVGFLVSQFGMNGFLISLGTIIPQNLLIIPIYLFSAALSIMFTKQMIKKHFIQTPTKTELSFVTYFYALLFMLIILIFAATIESYISPYLMKLIITKSNLIF